MQTVSITSGFSHQLTYYLRCMEGEALAVARVEWLNNEGQFLEPGCEQFSELSAAQDDHWQKCCLLLPPIMAACIWARISFSARGGVILLDHVSLTIIWSFTIAIFLPAKKVPSVYEYDMGCGLGSGLLQWYLFMNSKLKRGRGRVTWSQPLSESGIGESRIGWTGEYHLWAVNWNFSRLHRVAPIKANWAAGSFNCELIGWYRGWLSLSSL